MTTEKKEKLNLDDPFPVEVNHVDDDGRPIRSMGWLVDTDGDFLELAQSIGHQEHVTMMIRKEAVSATDILVKKSTSQEDS